nr:calcineurin B-like protein 10 [Ipomoea batatas]
MFLEQFEFCRNLEASFLRRMGAFHLVVGEASEENRGQFRQGREVQVKVAEAIGGGPGSLRRSAGAGAGTAVSDGAFVVAPFVAAQRLAGGEAFVADGALVEFRPPPPSLKFHFLNPFATRKFVGLKNETSTSFHQSSYLAFLLLLRCSLAPERLWRKWSQQLSSFFFKICDATVTVDFRRQQRRDNFWLQRTVTLLPSIFFPAAVGSSRASVLFSFLRQQVQLRLRSFSGNCSLLSLHDSWIVGCRDVNRESGNGASPAAVGRKMVVAILKETSLSLSSDALEAIIEKTFEDADSDIYGWDVTTVFPSFFNTEVDD